MLEMYWGALFLILFLIYPSTSAAIFATFQCEKLSDSTSWLRADLSIDCDSPTHLAYRWFAGFMVLLYPIGTPVLYWRLLRRCREDIEKLQVRDAAPSQIL